VSAVAGTEEAAMIEDRSSPVTSSRWTAALNRTAILAGLLLLCAGSAVAQTQAGIRCRRIAVVDPGTNQSSNASVIANGACSVTLPAGSGFRSLDITLRLDPAITLAGEILSVGVTGPSSISPATWILPAPAAGSSYVERVFRWRGKVGREPLYVDVVVADSIRETVVIRPASSALRPYRLTALGGGQAGWQGEPLGHAVGVVIRDISPAACTRQRIAFSSGGGAAVVPDTVFASWSDSRCAARTAWRLPKDAGRHHLRARIVGTAGGRSETFIDAIARRSAYLISGVVGVWNARNYNAVVRSADTVVVTEEVPDGSGGKISTTHTVIMKGSPEAERQDLGTEVDPMLGVSFALFSSWDRLRAWAGVSLDDIDRAFYTGISILPLWRRWKAESSIIDIAIGVRFVRRDTANRDCADPGVDLCSRSSVLVDGPVFGVTVDGTTILSAVTKAFGL
jgi:hypothetical protein